MRAMWSGAVSFGLVSVPVKAYAATSNHDIRFHQVHSADGGRIKYKRTCSLDGQEVEYADIVKGYETEDGELITLTEEDLDSLPTATGHEIDVVEFVPADQIDPLLFDKSYYLEPDAKAAKPYALLREALVQTDRMAVVKVALRQRETMALLRVRDKAIVLQTMLWPDEVREPDFEILDADGGPAPAGAEDGGLAGGEPGRRLRPHRVPRRVPRGRGRADRTEEDDGRRPAGPGGAGAGGRRGRQHDGPAHRPAAQRRGGEGGVRQATAEAPAEPKKAPARRPSTKKKADEDDKPAARKRTRKPA